MKQSGVPWTMIFGNHDHEQGLTRDELFDMVKAAPNCLMEKGNVKGVGNYILDIESKDSDKTAMTLWILMPIANKPG